MFASNGNNNNNNNSNSWGASTGFGKSSSFSGSSGNTSGGLFGGGPTNSTTTSNTGGLFGGNSTNASTAPTSGGLFGNSSTNNTLNTQSSGTGLFGNSNKRTTSGGFNLQPPPAASAAASGGGGLFGGNKTQATTGLFGGSNNANQSTGLFGSNSSTIGSNNTTNNNSGGLFGNTSNTNGLFGSSNNTNNTINSQNSNTQGGGLFGGGNTSGGGLFGNSNNNNINNGGNPLSNQFNSNGNVGQPNGSSNPYNYDISFSNIRQNIDSMPKSITESLFLNSAASPSVKRATSETTRKRAYSDVSKQTTSQASSSSSLLSRLGQTIKYFSSSFTGSGSNASEKPDSDLKGIFTSSNYVNFGSNKTSSTFNSKLPNSFKQNSAGPRRDPAGRHSQQSDFKRLVIKSKPSKFHLIDTDKVFSTKRRRILVGNTSVVSSDHILNDSSDEEDNILENDDSINAGYSSQNNPKLSEQSKTNEFKKTTVLNQEKIEEENKLDDKDLNNGYWCSPSISKLSKLSLEELAYVENFIVGRVGYGQVSYSYEVDLSTVALASKKNGTTLNQELFDNIIVIGKKHLLVYEGYGDNKPPIGVGLNVPATITLENMFPKKNESSGEFINRLKSQKGMDFVTYDPITGSWTFKVMHFSVWGLIDEEDVESGDEKLVSIKRKQDRAEEESRIEASKIYGNPDYRDEIKRQKIKTYTNKLPGGWGNNMSESQLQDQALEVKRGLVNEEVNEQLIRYQDEQRISNINDEVADITIDEEQEDMIVNSPHIYNGVSHRNIDGFRSDDDHTGFNDVDGNKLKYLKQLVSILPRNIDLNDLVDEKAYEPEVENERIFDNIQVRPNLAISDDWLVQLELSNDFGSSLNPLTWKKADLPKSNNGFRGITAEDVDNVIFADFNHDASAMEQDPELKWNTELEKKSISPTKVPTQISSSDDSISKVLDDLLAKSTLLTRGNDFPKLDSVVSFSFKDFLNSLRENDEDLKTIKLCFALFEEIAVPDIADSDNDSLKNHLISLQRRKAISDMVKELNTKAVDELRQSGGKSDLDEIFYRICSGDLEGAVDLAITSKNLHLASLLTLLDSNDSGVRTTAAAQLDAWEFASIPISVKNIYLILSGKIDSIGNLPWNIRFSLELLYGDSSVPITKLISDKDTSSDSSPILDTLRIYSLVNARESHSRSESIASSLAKSSLPIRIKWIIAVIITSIIRASSASEFTTFDLVGDKLTKEFGEYLISNGLLKEAVFVYTRLSEDNESAKIIKSLIFDNIEIITETSSEDYYVNNLKIKDTILFQAIAEDEFRDGDYWEQCQNLVHAKLWEEVHDCLFNYLGPLITVSNNPHRRNDLLNFYYQIPNKGLVVPQWSVGAGIYVQYFQLLNLEDDLQQQELSTSTEYKSLVQSLLTNIPLMIASKSTFSFINEVAVKIMSKKIGDLAIELGISSKEQVLALKLGENEIQYFNVRLNAIKA